MSNDDKRPVQKNSFSSSLSESESSSDSDEYSNQYKPIKQSRILEPDSNSNFLTLNKLSTAITLSSIPKKDDTKKFEKFICENTKSDMPMLSPILGKNDDESLEDESIQYLADNIKKNDNDLNFKDEEGEESLKMLGKKRKKSHNSEIDNDLDPLKGKDLIY